MCNTPLQSECNDLEIALSTTYNFYIHISRYIPTWRYLGPISVNGQKGGLVVKLDDRESLCGGVGLQREDKQCKFATRWNACEYILYIDGWT